MPINFGLLDIGQEHREDGVTERDIVRVRTSYWHDHRGLHMRKDITRLKKLSTGQYDVLIEEALNISAEDTFALITNLDKCGDGIYEVIVNVTGRDYETGYADDWEFTLVPYVE